MIITIVVVMKKVFTLLALCFLASVAWAEDIVFVAGVDNGNSPGTAAPYTIMKDGVTVTVSNGLANETQYRVYKGSTITICSQVGEISKIVFECVGEGNAQYGPACFVTDTGEYSCEGRIGVWTGCDPCVTFTAALNQVRMTKITVTVGECGGLGAPIINPASGTYYEPVQVSMTCHNSGAVIHYTTNGSDPTEQSTVYTAPFTVDQDVTVKAISILDGEVSEVVTATYVFITVSEVNCFEDLEWMPEGEQIRFMSPVYALAQHTRYLFVKDGCGGYGLIYGNVNQTYQTGDVIPAGFVVTKTFYSGEMELINPSNFKPAIDNIPIEPEQITPDQAGHDMFCHYVILEHVSIIEEDGVYYAVDSLDNRIPIYFGSLGGTPPVNLTGLFDITGIIGSYGKNNTVIYQLLPIVITRIPEIRIGLGNYWQYVSPNTETVTFDYDATVILQAGSYLYAKDETGYGLIYGPVDYSYSHGDVIPAGYGGTVQIYDGFPEVARPFFGFQPAKDHVTVEPELVTIPQIDKELWAHYVILVDVYVDKEKKVIRDRNGNELPYFVRSGSQFTAPEGWTSIRGIVDYYHDQPQLLVWNNEPPIPMGCLYEYINDPEMEGRPFNIKLVVIYQNGASLYVKDLCDEYILMYGVVDGNYVNGDTIEVVVSFGSYQGHRQLIPVGDCRLIGHGPAVDPEEFACIEELSQDMCHWYIRLNNVKIVTDEDGNTYIEDECGSLLLFNKFGVILPSPGDPIVPARNPYDLNGDGEVGIADVNFLIALILSGEIERDWFQFPTGNDYGERTFDITGFLTIYRDQLEFCPIFITFAGMSECIVGDLNRDNEVNVADLNELYNHILNQLSSSIATNDKARVSMWNITRDAAL